MLNHIKINGQYIPVWEYGDVNKPLLVFIHGFPCPFSKFGEDTPIKYIQNDFHILGFDLPQFGNSKYINMDIIEFIHTVIYESTKKSRYMVFGISFGGMVSLKYAHTYPKEVKGAIVCGMPYYDIYPRVLMRVLTNMIKLIDNRFHNVLTNFMFLNKENLVNIKQPVLLLYSRKDKIARMYMGRKLKNIIPHADIIEAHDRGHLSLLNKIEQCNFLDAMYSFMYRCNIK